MDFELIGNLIRLRYKLLWANTRTRNGKIALFFAGYLLLVMVLALLGAGGVGAGSAGRHAGCVRHKRHAWDFFRLRVGIVRRSSLY